jgi:hypothetical protein
MLKRKCYLVCLSGALFALATSPLCAQGTPEQREACTPDVFRLCGSFIPDPSAITACLKKRKADLSNNCRQVLYPVARPDEAGSRPNSQVQFPR